MKKLLIALAVLATTAIGFEEERQGCIENHGGPPNVPTAEKVGRVAGYGAYTLFLGDGAYGLDQTTIDTIEDWNADFQANEYDPRQEQATEIWEWIQGRHEIDVDPCPCCGGHHATMEDWEAERNDMLNDMHGLDAEIDTIWAELTDDIRALVSNEDYSDFLDAH